MTDVIQHVPILEPRVESVIHPEGQLVKVSTFGAQQIVHTQISAQGTPNISDCAFTSRVNSNMIYDRELLLNYTLRATLTATTVDTIVPVADYAKIVLQAYPLSRVMKTLNITLNNQQFSVEPAKFGSALRRYQNNVFNKEQDSNVPTQFDTYNNQARLVTAGVNSPFDLTDPSARIHFGPVVITQTQARSATLPEIVTMEWNVQESLLHPFFSGHESEALVNINNLDVRIQWNNLAGAFTTNSPVATVAYDFSGNPSLRLTGRVPSVNIPQQVTLPYSDWTKNYNQTVTVPAGGKTTLETGNITWSEVPDKLYIFARQTADISSSIVPDGFCNIESLILRTEYDNGSFSGANSHSLYKISKENGLDMSYREWSDSIGSILCIDFNKDVGGLTAGARIGFTFDMQVVLKNTFYSEHGHSATLAGRATTNAPTAFTFYLLPVFSGTMTVTNNGGMLVSSGSDTNQLASSISSNNGFVGSGMLGGSHLAGASHLGGGLFSGFAKSMATPVKMVKLGSMFAPRKARAGVMAIEQLSQMNPKDLLR